MKIACFAPSISIYNALMNLAARDQAWLFAWAIFDDMLHSGHEPTTTTIAHLIQVALS
jgi:pentatricopeptide repeat protein